MRLFGEAHAEGQSTALSAAERRDGAHEIGVREAELVREDRDLALELVALQEVVTIGDRHEAIEIFLASARGRFLRVDQLLTDLEDLAVAVEERREHGALGLEAELGPGRLPLLANLGAVIVRTKSGEDLWARPQSPCHGVILSVPTPQAQVGYGETVLWDGQPLGQVTIRGRLVHHFPLLGGLRPGDAHTLPFWGHQPERGALLALNQQLPDAVWLHVRGEESRPICQVCLKSGGPHQEGHQPAAPLGAHPVEGQVVIEAELNVPEGRRLVEAAAAQAGLSLSFTPP